MAKQDSQRNFITFKNVDKTLFKIMHINNSTNVAVRDTKVMKPNQHVHLNHTLPLYLTKCHTQNKNGVQNRPQTPNSYLSTLSSVAVLYT